MYEGRRGTPWLPALIAGGIGAALISKRARWHHSQHGQGRGFGAGEMRIPPRIEEMLNAWHRRAHGETAAPTDKASGEAGPPTV